MRVGASRRPIRLSALADRYNVPVARESGWMEIITVPKDPLGPAPVPQSVLVASPEEAETVTATLAVTSSTVTVTFAVPALTPVTMPHSLTVATAVLEDAHMPPVVTNSVGLPGCETTDRICALVPTPSDNVLGAAR